jgi:hypothetical protein
MEREESPEVVRHPKVEDSTRRERLDGVSRQVFGRA